MELNDASGKSRRIRLVGEIKSAISANAMGNRTERASCPNPLAHEKTALFLGSIAAVVEHRVTLAESQILKPVVELRLLVDQTRGWAGRAAREKSSAESYRKNE
jgi:hypothetical protein